MKQIIPEMFQLHGFFNWLHHDFLNHTAQIIWKIGVHYYKEPAACVHGLETELLVYFDGYDIGRSLVSILRPDIDYGEGSIVK